MPTWVIIYLPKTGKWQAIRSVEYPAYYSVGWRLY